MTQLSNMLNSEKYQQDKVIITQLDFAYFEKDYRLIAVDLSKQKALDADLKVIQQIIFTGHVDDEAITVLYILENSKKQCYNFLKEQRKCCNCI